MQRAVYKCKVPDYNGGFKEYSIIVDIVGESAKSYKVKYLQLGYNNQPAGTVKWVRKHNIKIN